METFVVRVFVPTDGAELELAGIVEHIGRETEEPFRGEDGLLDVVQRGLRRSAREAELHRNAIGKYGRGPQSKPPRASP